MFEAKKAEREKVKLLVGLDGPSGSGKTLSSLKLAHGITGDWSRIALADTENGSANYYAGEMTGDWLHIPFDAGMRDGYSPANFVKLIEYAETQPIDVLIIDSISHEWNGSGGCLEIVSNIPGNSFAAWKSVTPLHNKFIDKLRHSRLHIIATMRSKTEYVLEENDKGKKVPKKMGLASIQREGVDYEFGVMFSIDLLTHRALVEKDRTNMFKDRTPFMIDEAIGIELRDWASGGADPVYKGTPEQKRNLMAIAVGIQKDIKGDALKALHEAMLGKKLTNLKKLIAKELKK